MEFGLYTLGDLMAHPTSGVICSEHQRMKGIVEMAKLAEEAGLDVFGVGESHQELFIASSPAIILATIAGITKRIKLISASTVLSTLDPVRVSLPVFRVKYSEPNYN